MSNSARGHSENKPDHRDTLAETTTPELGSLSKEIPSFTVDGLSVQADDGRELVHVGDDLEAVSPSGYFTADHGQLMTVSEVVEEGNAVWIHVVGVEGIQRIDAMSLHVAFEEGYLDRQ